MKQILGKPIIGHLLARLSLSQRIDKIVLATSSLPENDEMSGYVQKSGFDVYRGSEDDVLDRFYQVAKKYKAELIVRITGDCPLIDPHVCDEVIAVFIKGGFDYGKTGPTFAEGLDCEVFTLKALKKAWEEAKLKSEREHVTLYFFKHPEIFKTMVVANKTDDSKYRLSVDEERDFQLVRAVYEYFSREGKTQLFADDIKRFLDTHKSVFELNADIVRNEGLLKSLKSEQTISREK